MPTDVIKKVILNNGYETTAIEANITYGVLLKALSMNRELFIEILKNFNSNDLTADQVALLQRISFADQDGKILPLVQNVVQSSIALNDAGEIITKDPIAKIL